ADNVRPEIRCLACRALTTHRNASVFGAFGCLSATVQTEGATPSTVAPGKQQAIDGAAPRRLGNPGRAWIRRRQLRKLSLPFVLTMPAHGDAAQPDAGSMRGDARPARSRRRL